jgi:hypothetical protein
MFLGISTLAVAIVISVVAAYYSILGLTAIFAAAFWPIVIMGGALEAGKLMTAVWLHRNWNRASWTYKCYLVPALAFLMLLTSMGIFGFLSKAHLDQTVPTGDVAAQVSLIDEKIKIERDNIANAQAVIKQMDAAVNGVIASGDQEVKLKDGSTKLNSAAERSLQIRRQQARDRAALTKQVEQAQANIVKLQEQKAPIAKDLRKIEAEVGPVKYVAALIYGDNPDINTLEKAVRWVIILIVLVFDPLAIVLILAGSKQIEWARGINFEHEDHHREVMRQREIEQEEKLSNEIDTARDIDIANSLIKDTETDIDFDAIESQAKEIQELELAYNKQTVELENLKNLYKESSASLKTQRKELDQKNQDISLLEAAIGEMTGDIKSLETQNYEYQTKSTDLDKKLQTAYTEIEAKNAVIERLEQRQQELLSMIQAAEEAAAVAQSELDAAKAMPRSTVNLDDLAVVADNNDSILSSEAGFGGNFPTSPNKGDLFLRVDYLPSKLFKWNGVKWIEVDKSLTDSYTYNEKYIEHLIDRIGKGEYDSDDLSDNEREQIASYIQRQKNAQ